MHLEVSKPRLKEFIDSQVKAGHFASPQAAIEAAVEQMMLDHGELDAETVAAIVSADAQYARGEYMNWRDIRSELRKKYTGK